jgi:hypothetical protein
VPVLRGGIPRAVAAPRDAEAAPEAQIEPEFVARAQPSGSAVATRPAVRKVPVVPPQPESELEQEPEGETNWTLAEDPPPDRPRRDRPLRREDAAPTQKAPALKAKAAKITPPPAPRQKRKDAK